MSSDSPMMRELATGDLSKYKFTPPRSFTMVRYPLKVRQLTQYIPQDSLVLEALLILNGTRIESRRRPLEEKTVFSNRFQGDQGPSLYTASLWNGFAQRGMELNDDSEFVLKLDIADFYDSIRHSHLGTSLAEAGVPPDHLACLMNALAVSSGGVPMGIPVGPHFSHLLAELHLTGLDDILTSERVAFTRFNDDIHIFGKTIAEIDRANSVANRYLRNVLGLSVNPAKQEVTSSSTYIKWATTRNTPRSSEEQSLHKSKGQRFPFYHARPTNQDLAEGRRHFRTLGVAKILAPYLESPSSDEGLAYVLRLMRSRGVPNGLGFVIDNLDKLFPVITEALCYMETVAQTQTQVTKKQLRKLFAFYASPVVMGSPFLQIMTLRIIGKVADLSNLNKFVEEIDYISADGRRELIFIAKERQTLEEWVNVQRKSKDWMGAWEQSALALF